jgi:hypothetical protein
VLDYISDNLYGPVDGVYLAVAKLESIILKNGPSKFGG